MFATLSNMHIEILYINKKIPKLKENTFRKKDSIQFKILKSKDFRFETESYAKHNLQT